MIRLVVVDDERLLLESLRRLLDEIEDFTVVATAASVAEALAVGSDVAADVLIVDRRLPDGSGIDLGRMLREKVNPDLKVILITGTDEHVVLLDAIEAGFNGYLTKDKAPRELVAAVRAAVAGESLLSPAAMARLLPALQGAYRGAGSRLTARELEVLRLLAAGTSTRKIASMLGISHNTARNHVQSILGKLGAHSKLEAVAVAVREGVVPRD